MTAIISVMGGIFLGLIFGGAVVWLIASSRLKEYYSKREAALRMDYAGQIAETEGKARSAEAVVNELRQQIQQKESDINVLRGELGLEKQFSARLEESQRHLREEMERFETTKNELIKTFGALSLEALSKNSAEFLRLAEEKLKSQSLEGRKELESKKELIDRNIEAIGKTMSEVQRRVEEVGRASGEKFVEVATLIKKHEEVTTKLKDTTEHLRHAFASSKKRGEWGERMAEDIIRLIGMSEGLNYIKQKTIEESSNRPDYTFLLPNNLKINMDVKFPLDNYQHYLDAHSDHDRKRFKEELLKNAKTMIKQVTNRNYINPSDNTVDYVIVFIPNEQVYSFINEADTTIMDEALAQKVILCSPFTLYAVLAVVRQAVENFNLERTASEILKLLGDFYKQWNVFSEKFRVMGDRIDAAKKEYDALVTTRTNQLEKPLRKIEELRKQKAIALEGELRLDDTAPL